MPRRKHSVSFYFWLVATGLLLASLAPGASAQGSRKDDIVFNSRGLPLAGATVRVCAMPATGQPCAPLAAIFSDIALTQAIPNPTVTDGLGNYFFHAAPGKYMVEISGPGIVTRQIPNVILPSDPTAPAFSSVNTSGNITGFSLNLGGNLTVSGNTTVLGNLSGATLNLTNQAVLPGTAATGTVNLYTKTDKRLYYKDDTGVEIGPVANTTGAQTNVANTWTATQSFDGDTRMKGPNPWYDIMRFGGVASIQTTTGGMTAGLAVVTLAAAQDFANGQGIVVAGAGALPTLATPTGVVATPQNIVNGTTTYNYQVACEDYAGGITPSSAAGVETNGPATLGPQASLTILSGVRANGVVTVTTSVAHNLAVGAPVNITVTNNNDFNGTFIITSVPTSTTFTFNQSTAPNANVVTGTAQGIAYNKVTWNTLNANLNLILRCWIYRGTQLVGVTSGQDTYFEDYGAGLAAGSLPAYVPATAPVSATPGYLATTIVSGGGSTSLTLAATASTAVTGAAVVHDNVPALVAAANAAIGSQRGGVVYIPNTGSSTPIQLNSLWQMPSPGLAFIKYVIAGGLNITQPIIPSSGATIEGVPGSATVSSPAFGRSYYAQLTCGTSSSGVSGNGVCPFPFFYVQPTRANLTLRNLQIYSSVAQEIGVLADTASDGSGSAYLIFDNSYFSMGPQGVGVWIKGGFGFYFNNSGFNTAGSVFGSPQAVRFGLMNSATGGGVSGIVHFADCVFNGTGVQVDSLARSATGGGQQWSFRNTLFEGGTSNFLRVNIGGNVFTANYLIQNVDYADPRGGFATPLVDVTNTTNLQGMEMVTVTTANSSMPLVVGDPGALSIRGTLPATAGAGSSRYMALTTNNFLDMHNLQVVSTGAGINVPISPPASTPSVAVSAGGSVPAGQWAYAVSKVDFNGKETLAGPDSVFVTVTTGNQTVTVDCTDTIGGNVQFLRIYRRNPGGGYGLVNGASSLTTCHVVDTSSFTSGSAPAFTTAGDPSFDANGVAASKFRISGELLQSSPRAQQNVLLPGALTTTWTGSTWTIDKAITVTRVEAQAKTVPAGCTTAAIVRLTDGITPVNLTIAAAANSSGAISQNYAAGAALTISVSTAAAGCTTSPADVNVTVQYRMQ